MADRTDHLTITVAIYTEPMWGAVKLGTGRYSFNLYKFSIIVEWWGRQGLS